MGFEGLNLQTGERVVGKGVAGAREASRSGGQVRRSTVSVGSGGSEEDSRSVEVKGRRTG